MPDMTYAAQFEVLLVWIGTLDSGELSQPSALPGWTVADLVGHLAGTGTSIATLVPAPDEAEPMALADYVAAYASSAEQIADLARDITIGAGPDLLETLDAANVAAQRNLDQLGGLDRVVQARRGPILLSDFLDTRLIELVVHAGDLTRSLPDRNGPMVMPSAVKRVVSVLRELLTAKADNPVEALAAASALPAPEFIELAAGRRAPAPELAPALAEALPLF